MEFLDPKLDEYAVNRTSPESALLHELNRQTHLKVLQPRMLSGHLQGRALAMFSKMIQPKNILEVGTYTGYSALCLAEGLVDGGELHTIDVNSELKSMIEEYVSKSEFQGQIHLHIGEAMEIIPSIQRQWDLVFIDADKENYSNYFDAVIDSIPSGGYIIADNVLWSGKVIEDVDPGDEETQAIIDYSAKVHADDRVENVLLPVRDGLMICRKR